MCRLTAGGVPPAEAARVALTTRGGDTGLTTADRPAPAATRRGGAGGGLPLGDVRRECRGLARAAVRLDSAELESRLPAAIQDHGLVVAWEDIVVPTLRAVGRKWASSADRYVEVEHLLSWHVSTALRRAPLLLPRAASPAGAPPVVLACAPGEQHALPIEALHAALDERGVPCLMLGAAVPPEALLAAVRRTGPAAVVLWSQARATAASALARRIDGLRWGAAGARGRPFVLPAGPGWDRRALRGFPRCSGLGDAVGLLRALYAPDGTVRRMPHVQEARGGPSAPRTRS
jgi:methanogenic corrinoid protein MtbC1